MTSVTSSEYKRQCVLAARSSRLDPKALHLGERQILGPAISDSEKIAYLQIRNGLLRLWTRNPSVYVSREEAIECAKDKPYLHFAPVAHEWLVRNGYINFGCLSTVDEPIYQPAYLTKRKVIIIIGGGVAGLACARQLDNYIKQFSEKWLKKRRELLPRILILEGRKRIGGRVYSHPLKSQVTGHLPHELANTAELGAHIVTGFANGNPLDAVIRGQLALPHHMLTDDLMIYDHDGRLIDVRDDDEMADVYEQIINAASEFGWKPMSKADPNDGEVKNGIHNDPKSLSFINPGLLTETNGNGLHCAIGDNRTEGLNGYTKPPVAKPNYPHPSLGAFVDELANMTQQQKGYTADKMRVLNWHIAHLEYGNACNLRDLSLGGWDQDKGNEFGGRHAQVIGGYIQLPKALWLQPEPLDVEFAKAVTNISYLDEKTFGRGKAAVTCSDGSSYQADHVVCTIPLGVLHQNNITFSPQLPSWKTSVWQRMGFGVLNKVILLFDHVFWDPGRDMFGCLNQTKIKNSTRQQDYAADRGRSFLFWNCVKTTGRPLLIALMAGDAAEAQEHCADNEVVSDVTTKLSRIFQLPYSPRPLEAIVTRWRRDPFARGSYSYLGPEAQPGDYDLMAAQVGNLHFAGEATCGSHPATVHGAFLSGLRAASEVLESMIGPVPTATPAH